MSPDCSPKLCKTKATEASQAQYLAVQNQVLLRPLDKLTACGMVDLMVLAKMTISVGKIWTLMSKHSAVERKTRYKRIHPGLQNLLLTGQIKQRERKI